MAASMCDVFSFCVGVAGGARGSVEVRFVSSTKVRPGRTPPEEPRRGLMLTFWSPGPSAPIWFLLGPGVQGLSSCPGSWRYRAGEAQPGTLRAHPSQRNPVHWRVAVLPLSWVELRLWEVLVLRDILGQIKGKDILARLGLSCCSGGSA